MQSEYFGKNFVGYKLYSNWQPTNSAGFLNSNIHCFDSLNIHDDVYTVVSVLPSDLSVRDKLIGSWAV